MNIQSKKVLSAAIFLYLFGTNLLAQQSLSKEQFTADFDSMWTGLRDNYVYFGKKETDWNKVRELYRPGTIDAKDKRDFVALIEKALDELYDNHTSLNINFETSPRLVPTGLDVWAEWIDRRAVITELRRGFSADQAGLKAGMEIIKVNGLPVEEAVTLRLPKSLRLIDDEARNWALRAVLAGMHDKSRTITVIDEQGDTATYKLDLPTHTTVDNYQYEPKVEWKILPRQIAYLKINDLISSEIVAQFNSALEAVRNSRALILDLRDIPKGGNTDVAEPIMGRLISRPMGYQMVVPLHEPEYIKEVVPGKNWIYKAPIIVLVNHWTASMGEGMAIGLDGMKRAVIVGTPMAGLNGGIFTLELPYTRIGVTYPGEKLNHINGTPRENFIPPVLVNLTDKSLSPLKDPVFEIGYRKAYEIIKSWPDSSSSAPVSR